MRALSERGDEFIYRTGAASANRRAARVSDGFLTTDANAIVARSIPRPCPSSKL
jgi:hypothetical protein